LSVSWKRKESKLFVEEPHLKVLAREMKSVIEVEEEGTAISPPKYKIDNICMAIEGAVTLNQVYNILDEDVESLEE